MPGYQQHIKYVLITGRQGGGKLNPSGSVLHLFFWGKRYLIFTKYNQHFGGKEAWPGLLGKKQLYLSVFLLNLAQWIFF